MLKKLSYLIFLMLISSVLYAQPLDSINYLNVLKNATKYDNDNKKIPKFIYESSNDKQLVALRKAFKLDSIAGFGNEESRILNLLHWVHNSVKHNGQEESGIKNINASEILQAAISKHIGVSCGELATTLNDCYLAMGWNSRKIYCFPRDSLHIDRDSHVINVVYLLSKNKWIWVDPTNDAYVMDDKGNLLSIEEVRERLIEDKPLIVNPDANWNRRTSITKNSYLDIYMAKNLYRLYCPLNSEFDYETWGRNGRVIYVNLLPPDQLKKVPYKTDDYYNTRLKTTFVNYYTSNSRIFWQTPEN